MGIDDGGEMTAIAGQWLHRSNADMNGRSSRAVVVAEGSGDFPTDRLLVAVEEGGRVRIPRELYERIGSGPGGLVQMRRCGSTVIIERLP